MFLNNIPKCYSLSTHLKLTPSPSSSFQLNVDSDSEEEKDQHPDKGNNNTQTESIDHQLLNGEPSAVVDNLQSWKNVETMLANPQLYQPHPDYLSQFTETYRACLGW